MSTEITRHSTNTALTIAEDQTEFTDQQIAALRQIGLGQLLEPGPEHADPLGSVELHVQSEVLGDLRQRHARFTRTSDANHVLAELLGIGPCHGDILPACPRWASQLRCHLIVQQTPRR